MRESYLTFSVLVMRGLVDLDSVSHGRRACATTRHIEHPHGGLLQDGVTLRVGGQSHYMA
jgi:hypothetical protein